MEFIAIKLAKLFEGEVENVIEAEFLIITLKTLFEARAN